MESPDRCAGSTARRSSLGRRADTGTAVTLTADWLERHVFVSGATGTGKTAFLLALALQMLDRGRGVLFCTTKHDPALPRALAWAAASRDRLGEFWLFDAMQVAHTYNPTATDNPLLLVRQVLALLPPVPPGSEAAYHQDVVRQFLLAAVRAMMATGREPVLDDILQLAVHPDLALPMLRQALHAVGALERIAELDSFFDRFRIGGQWRLDLAQNALAGLTAALEALRVGRMERLFRRPSSELSLLRAIRRAAIIYMGLPRAQDKESGRFGQLFLADLDAVIQEIQATEGRLAHAPFTIILDEFASYAIHEFAAVFEQARSAGIAVVVSVQTPSALADVQRGLSEEFRDACVGNCGTILSFRLGPGRGAPVPRRLRRPGGPLAPPGEPDRGPEPDVARPGPRHVVRPDVALGPAVALPRRPAAEGPGPRGARADAVADPRRRGVPPEPARTPPALDRVGGRRPGPGRLALPRAARALDARPAPDASTSGGACGWRSSRGPSRPCRDRARARRQSPRHGRSLRPCPHPRPGRRACGPPGDVVGGRHRRPVPVLSFLDPAGGEATPAPGAGRPQIATAPRDLPASAVDGSEQEGVEPDREG